MALTEEKKDKVKKILSKKGYINIRFEEGCVIATNPEGLEATMTDKEVLMTFAFVKK